MRLIPPLRLPRLGLRTRLSIGVIAIVLLTTFGVATAALYFVKKHMREAIAEDQVGRVATISDAIDQKFLSRRTLLKTFGDSVEAQRFTSAAPLQAYLEAHTSLKEAFDNVSFLDRDGNLVANLNGARSNGRLNVKDRPYFIDTVASRAGVISRPFVNRLNGMPQVTMTQPVFAPNGEVVYVISGSINLQQQNFLGELADTKFGKSGYLFILNSEGVMIDHPRKARILKHFRADGGSNVSAEMAIKGFEGSTESVNTFGVHGLYAYKRIRQTDWIIGAIYPRDEAFAPIDAIERNAWLGALLLALLAGGATLAVLRHELDPLGRLHDHVRAAHDARAYVASTVVFPGNEIGDLARSFERLMQQRQASESRLHASEKYLRDVLAHAGDAFVGIDRDGAITEWNRQAEVTFGWNREEAMGNALADMIIPPESREGHHGGMSSFVRTGRGPVVDARIEVLAMHRDGRRIPVELSVASVDMGDHFVANAFLRDIKVRKAAEEQLASAEKFLRAITDNMPALIAYVDDQLRYRFCNRTFQTWAGLDPAAMLGRTMREVIGEAAHAARSAQFARALAGEVVEFEAQAVGHGPARAVKTLYLPDVRADGSVAGFYGLVTDISAAKQLEARLEKLARIDALTGLANRRQFEENLASALARAQRSRKAVALMFLDIDHFKRINDRLGHAAGDAAIREFGDRLRRCVRTTDSTARLGGDEFVVVLENLGSEAETELVARKVLAAMAEPFDLEGRAWSVTTSIGVAYHAAGAVAGDALLARADEALYEAKANGRNGYSLGRVLHEAAA